MFSLALFVGFLPVNVVVYVILAMAGITEESKWFAFAYMAICVVSGIRNAFFRCPVCKKMFNLRSLALECMHCGAGPG